MSPGRAHDSIDMVDVEKAGLVKFDFLGLRTLTIVDNTVRNVNQDLIKKGQSPINLNDLDLESEEVYKNLQHARTTAVFQLESRGMKDLMRKVRPNCFNDIVALVALFRPGPMQLAEVLSIVSREEKVDFAPQFEARFRRHIWRDAIPRTSNANCPSFGWL